MPKGYNFTKDQHILFDMMWQGLVAGLAMTGADWADAALILQRAADTAQSNSDFGLAVPRKG